MIHNIRDAFNELLDKNVWMDAKTKAVAKEKVTIINTGNNIITAHIMSFPLMTTLCVYSKTSKAKNITNNILPCLILAHCNFIHI